MSDSLLVFSCGFCLFLDDALDGALAIDDSLERANRGIWRQGKDVTDLSLDGGVGCIGLDEVCTGLNTEAM